VIINLKQALTRVPMAGALVLAAVSALGAPPRLSVAPAAAPSWIVAPARYVRPLVGAAGHGSTFPGATVPFGMVQWSPDTLGPSPNGYDYTATRLRGFSLTHLSGSGCPTHQDLPFLPSVGPSPAALAAHADGVGFSHADEEASPGYYRARLASGIDVRLTATARTGMARFTYPRTADARLLIDGGGSANGAHAASLRVVGPDEVRGWVTSGDFCAHNHFPYTIYVDLRFNRPIRRVDAWDGRTIRSGVHGADGPHAALVLGFDARRDPVVLAKVGLSYVDAAGASRNLSAEDPGWDVDGVRRAAADVWNGMLGRIRVAGGTMSETEVFYTALYHALLAPTIFGDVDGRYLGLDGRVRQAQGYTPYTEVSGWDIYRGEVQLLGLIAPDVASGLVRSLLAAGREGGLLPRWLLVNRSLNEMIGDPADPIIADAYAFGARDFDAGDALRQMVKGATQPGVGLDGYIERPGLADYLSLGYVPAGEGWVGPRAPASITLEYALDDFTVAQLAGALRETSTATAFLRRSQNWRALYNPATGYVEQRRPDGTWPSAFDPTNRWLFVEGNAAQYSWFVPHDPRGLIDAMGGAATARRRLDTFFASLNAGPSTVHAWMGNEPSFLVPWIYLWAGAPWRTQAVVRRIVTALFDSSPSGLPGNDDLGALSAWYVWAALGLYPAVPGTDVLALHGPLFPLARVSVPGGRLFTIEGPGAGADRPYVQSVTLDGRPYERAWLAANDLKLGTTLRVTLAATPNRGWGTAPSAAPPSFEPAATYRASGATP